MVLCPQFIIGPVTDLMPAFCDALIWVVCSERSEWTNENLLSVEMLLLTRVELTEHIVLLQLDK